MLKKNVQAYLSLRITLSLRFISENNLKLNL